MLGVKKENVEIKKYMEFHKNDTVQFYSEFEEKHLIGKVVNYRDRSYLVGDMVCGGNIYQIELSDKTTKWVDWGKLTKIYI